VVRITADSNIYISALNCGGVPDQVLDLARGGAIQLAISQAILDEVSRVLGMKFGWASGAIEMAREQISGFAERVEPVNRIDVVQEDPTDNRILECADAAGSEYIVTGDRHLLKLERYGAARILRPAEFLEIVAGTVR
jgi:putative PIN family toxin of toxin-antitoxin system